MRSTPRTYGGRSAEERQAERRRRLVDAAMHIWGEQGWAAVTMRGVCAHAGLIDRYFYENFADRDALLVAVWDQIREDTVSVLWTSIADKLDQHPLTQLRAAITAFMNSIASDPHLARILLGEHTGSEVLEHRRRETLQQFTDLLHATGAPHLKKGVDHNAFRMSILMGLGGFVELITAWQAGIVKADVDQIIDHASEVGADLAARFLPES